MSLSAERIAELNDLLWALCESDITPAQAARLETLVHEDPKCRRFYVRYMQLHAGLYWDRAGRCLTDNITAECFTAVKPAKPSQGRVARLTMRRNRRWVLFAAAAVLLLLATLVALVPHDSQRPPGEPSASEPEIDVQEFVAKITGTNDCVWEETDQDSPVAIGSYLDVGQRLRLKEGKVEIVFHVGAQVLLQGPAILDIESSRRAFLHAGKLTASVPEQARGFVIQTPSARVIDLGTQFGVDADDAGATDVYVFRGVVELLPGAGGVGGKKELLEAGQAKRVTVGGRSEPQPLLGPADFATALWDDLSLATVRPDQAGLGGDLRVDFEGTDGRIDQSQWYISGGVNTTRLRDNRSSEGQWGLSSEGTRGFPDVALNVKATGIDGNTSLAWGPFFTLNDPLPAGAKILLDIAGSGSPWSENIFSGPAGVALWDVATRDFARDASSNVIFVRASQNRFDLQPAEIPLEGLAGRSLGLVLVDRRSDGWGWVAVDNVRSTPGALRVHANLHHRVQIINDFDDANSLESWDGDLGSFQLGKTGQSGHTQGHINHRVRAGEEFPLGRGYLSSNTAQQGVESQGVIRSPAFTLDGDVIEFSLAGTGGHLVSLELVSSEPGQPESVIASSSISVPDLTWKYWPIYPDWVGQKAYVRLVDKSPRGYVEVDAIRMVDFDVDVSQ